jgi:hypothetical protein
MVDIKRKTSLIAISLGLILLLGTGGWVVYTRATAHPFRWPYNQPSGIEFEVQDISQAWQEWKSAQITSANSGGANRLRVLGGVDNQTTVSEGQAYGLLFASIFDDQATFDGLWLFAGDHPGPNGLMDWHIGAPGQRLGTGRQPTPTKIWPWPWSMLVSRCGRRPGRPAPPELTTAPRPPT